MFGNNKAAGAYGRVANTETNRLQQIVMLYDGAIKFLRLTASDIEGGDLHAKAEHSNRALDIISYLQSILDFERGGDVARSYDDLYNVVTTVIIRASASLDASEMRRAANLLSPVRDAWATIAGNPSNTTAAEFSPTPSTPQQTLAVTL